MPMTSKPLKIKAVARRLLQLQQGVDAEKTFSEKFRKEFQDRRQHNCHHPTNMYGSFPRRSAEEGIPALGFLFPSIVVP